MEENNDIVCPRCGDFMMDYGAVKLDVLGNEVNLFECPNCHNIKEEILV